MPLNNPPSQAAITTGGSIATSMWRQWFDSIKRLTQGIHNDGSYSVPTLSDAEASNNSLYYSSTQSKLVYKDSAGTVNDLY